MKAKILLILLILLSFTVIGCVDDEVEAPTETDMDNMTTEDVVNETANETVNDTDVDEAVEEEEESVTEEDEEFNVIEDEGPSSYTLYMQNFNVQPKNLTINTGDTVFWYNNNDPVRTFTLVSNEGLWENQSIVNRKNFAYTFNESGTYSYRVLTWEAMKGTITVK